MSQWVWEHKQEVFITVFILWFKVNPSVLVCFFFFKMDRR